MRYYAILHPTTGERVGFFRTVPHPEIGPYAYHPERLTPEGEWEFDAALARYLFGEDNDFEPVNEEEVKVESR